MFQAHQHRLKLLFVIILLGLLGDAMLRIFPWGLNAFVWFALILAVGMVYGRSVGIHFSQQVRWMIGVAFGFALLIAWRDAPALKMLNIFIVLTSVAIAAALAARRDLRHVWITGYLSVAVEALGRALKLPGATAPQFADSIRARERTADIPFLGILRGFLIAVPLLLLFGAFFISADARFETMVQDVFDFNMSDVVKHGLVACSSAWFAAAIVALCTEGLKKSDEREKHQPSSGRGAVEVNVVLICINLLFAAFVIIQFQYFFGTHERVINTAALTYAEYARRGFFELAAVAALALALLLTCARLVDETGPFAKRLFAGLGCALIALVLVILASSLHRMSIYIDVYGLTRLRFYTAAFSIWLGIAYLWLATTFVRARARDFAYGFVLSGYAAALLLQFSNPDAIIARVNIQRFHDGESFDSDYALSLSADAIPELVAALPEMPSNYRRHMQRVMNEKWDFSTTDLRTWSWARSRAEKAVQRDVPIRSEQAKSTLHETVIKHGGIDDYEDRRESVGRSSVYSRHDGAFYSGN